MRIDGVSALITGAEGGAGPALIRSLLDRGAAAVYAGIRDPGSAGETGAEAVALDVTDREQVHELARSLPDVGVVVNNAVLAVPGAALTASLDDARRTMDVNYLGIINVTQAFAPVLAGNGGGALVNVLSVLSWVAHPGLATYGASKSAAWSLTNALRLELRPQNTLVVGVHAGFVDTDIAAAMTGDKLRPEDVAEAVVTALEGDREEVLVDEYSRTVKAALHDDLGLLYGSHGR